MIFSFHKMQSLGNDFVMIDTSQFKEQLSFHRKFYEAVCNRTFGIGCDLIVLYSFESENIFNASFFNADGSEAEICGNASRCIGVLMKKTKNISKCTMNANHKTFDIQMLKNEDVSVTCEKASFNNSAIGLSDEIKNAHNLTTNNTLQKIVEGIDVYHISAISVGNPHVVLFVKNMPSIDNIKSIGIQIENNSLFENGVNICFVRILSNSEIELFVFERGCGLTLACGSGACAAVISSCENGFINSKSTVVQQRGGKLQIDINEDGSYSHIGSAAYVFSGISENLLKHDMFSIIKNKKNHQMEFLKEETNKIINDSAKITKDIIIYTDGACSGNPGPGGWGALIINNGEEKELSGYEEDTTNNRMELMAAIMALENINQPSSIELFTDSKYVKDGITKWISAWVKNDWKNSERKPVKNKDLWIKLLGVSGKHKVSWNWVKGHSANELNERVDFLARNCYENKKR